MTRILIIGGGGMIGQKLAQRLAVAPEFAGAEVHMVDVGFPEPSAPGSREVADVTDPATAQRLAAARYDVIFHLAAIVSGQAEQEFQMGWQVNALSLWQFLEALRDAHLATDGSYQPRLIFTSSIAVFGGVLPPLIPDDFHLAPATSYGAQKAVCEQMVSDASRKGYIHGLSLRLPTICIRPGKPNAAASGFYSGIIREPLSGQRAVLPVPDTLRHWFASPRAAVGFLIHAAQLETDALAQRRALNLPGVSATVAQQIEALRRSAGQKAVDLIDVVPDPDVLAIVGGWPEAFEAQRARELGFTAEENFDQIIEVYRKDDLPAA